MYKGLPDRKPKTVARYQAQASSHFCPLRSSVHLGCSVRGKVISAQVELCSIHLQQFACPSPLFLLYMYECFPSCVSVYHLHAWCSKRPEEGIVFPGTEITDSCEQPCGCWQSNPDPPEEQPVLLTADSFFQPYFILLSCKPQELRACLSFLKKLWVTTVKHLARVLAAVHILSPEDTDKKYWVLDVVQLNTVNGNTNHSHLANRIVSLEKGYIIIHLKNEI